MNHKYANLSESEKTERHNQKWHEKVALAIKC